MEKFLKSAFNFFWILIVGISSVIYNAVVGVSFMLTIIGIPFGLQYFKFLPLVFAPAGKVVVTKFGKHPIMNTLWLLFGGFETFLVYLMLSGVLSITIIGIPLAKQLFKIAQFNLAPFGAEIVNEEEYSKYGDTKHDMKLLVRRILADTNKIIGTKEDGTPLTIREYLEQNKEQYYKAKKSLSIYRVLGIITVILAIFVSIIIPTVIFSNMMITEHIKIVYIVILIIVLVFTISIVVLLEKLHVVKIMSKYFAHLELYFPNGSIQVPNAIFGRTLDTILYYSLDRKSRRLI